MHIRNALVITVMLVFSVTSWSANFVCGKDLNGDGLWTSDGETGSCEITPEGPLCPLNQELCESQPTCPLENADRCFAGSCRKPGVCSEKKLGFLTMQQCQHSGALFFSDKSCRSGCVESAVCTDAPTCPSGGKCLPRGDGKLACSSQACTDLDATQPEVTGIDDRVYIDDGRKDNDGMCLDQVMVFAGRNMECRLAGKSTAFRSCCIPFGEILTDSTGSVQELTAVTTTIGATAQAAKAAFDTYKNTKDALETTREFSKVFKSAIDPTSLAISTAIALSIDYFVNNCNEMDMETGILNASDRCYETGQYCKTKWAGECVQEAKTFCCFNSKLGKLIHEQGRSQLQSFDGVPANNCRGFYAEEFQYLDFSKIDLSGYYGDLKVISMPDLENNLNEKVENFVNQQP